MNDANPRWHHAEGGPDDERDPYAQDPYYQQQSYGYDQYGRPLQAPPAPQAPQVPQQQAAPAPPQGYQDQDPYYADPAQTYAGQQQGWIPQQPQQPYYEQPPQAPQQPRHPQQQGYDTGSQPIYDTGRQPRYETGQMPAYDTGQHAVYETGGQPVAYDTGRQPVYDTGRQPAAYDTGQHAVYETGQMPAYDTGQQPAAYDTGRRPGYETGQQPGYDTGGHPVAYDTGQHPVYDTGQRQQQQQQQHQAGPAHDAPAAPGVRRDAADGEPERAFHTEQFSFLDEESEESDEVIDWLKFSESRTERREEAKRRGRNRKIALLLALVLVVVGVGGYLWQAGKLPGLGKSKGGSAASGGGAQKRDVIVVHLLPVNGGPSSTALLVDNETKGRGSTVLVPGNLSVQDDDGTTTTLDKSVADGVGPTRDSLNTLLGADIKGSWRLDSPYLELLVDSVGEVLVDTDTAVKGTGKDSGKTLVPQGRQQELSGQAAVTYATYRGKGESQDKQLSRFGQVMQAVLMKLPSDAVDATKTVKALAQILDPSLTDTQLGASLAQLAKLAKTGEYDTTTLPVQKDGTLSAQATDDVVKNVLGGSVHASASADGGQARVEIRDASGNKKSGPMAQAAIVNGGTYGYVPGGTAAAAQPTSQVVYADPSRLAAAKDVAITLGLPASAVKKGTVPSNADISVVLGKDYKLPADDE